MTEKDTCHTYTALAQVGGCCVKGVSVCGEVKEVLVYRCVGMLSRKKPNNLQIHSSRKRNTTLILAGWLMCFVWELKVCYLAVAIPAAMALLLS